MSHIGKVPRLYFFFFQCITVYVTSLTHYTLIPFLFMKKKYKSKIHQ